MYFQCQFFSIVNLFFSGSGSFCRFLSTVITLSTTPGLYFTQTAKLSVFLKLSSQCLHFSSFGVGNFGISIAAFLPRWLTRFVNQKIIRVTYFLVFFGIIRSFQNIKNIQGYYASAKKSVSVPSIITSL